MAELNERLKINVPGKFYVDSSCIDCVLCRQVAPDIFTQNPDDGLSYVYRQPETPDEIAQAQDALDQCPTSSIGDDGDDSQQSAVMNTLGADLTDR